MLNYFLAGSRYISSFTPVVYGELWLPGVMCEWEQGSIFRWIFTIYIPPRHLVTFQGKCWHTTLQDEYVKGYVHLTKGAFTRSEWTNQTLLLMTYLNQWLSCLADLMTNKQTSFLFSRMCGRWTDWEIRELLSVCTEGETDLQLSGTLAPDQKKKLILRKIMLPLSIPLFLYCTSDLASSSSSAYFHCSWHP